MLGGGCEEARAVASWVAAARAVSGTYALMIEAITSVALLDDGTVAGTTLGGSVKNGGFGIVADDKVVAVAP